MRFLTVRKPPGGRYDFFPLWGPLSFGFPPVQARRVPALPGRLSCPIPPPHPARAIERPGVVFNVEFFLFYLPVAYSGLVVPPTLVFSSLYFPSHLLPHPTQSLAPPQLNPPVVVGCFAPGLPPHVEKFWAGRQPLMAKPSFQGPFFYPPHCGTVYGLP